MSLRRSSRPVNASHTRDPDVYQQDGRRTESLGRTVQEGRVGLETIASLVIAIPPVADNALQITVTLKVSEDKKLRVKTTVAESGSVQEFGPFPVDDCSI